LKRVIGLFNTLSAHYHVMRTCKVPTPAMMTCGKIQMDSVATIPSKTQSII
jgi:hypothetical protein